MNMAISMLACFLLGVSLTRTYYETKQQRLIRDFMLALGSIYESTGELHRLNFEKPDPAREQFVAVQERSLSWTEDCGNFPEAFEDALLMSSESMWLRAWLKAAPSFHSALRDYQRLTLAERYIADPVRHTC